MSQSLQSMNPRNKGLKRLANSNAENKFSSSNNGNSNDGENGRNKRKPRQIKKLRSRVNMDFQPRIEVYQYQLSGHIPLKESQFSNFEKRKINSPLNNQVGIHTTNTSNENYNYNLYQSLDPLKTSNIQTNYVNTNVFNVPFFYKKYKNWIARDQDLEKFIGFYSIDNHQQFYDLIKGASLNQLNFLLHRHIALPNDLSRIYNHYLNGVIGYSTIYHAIRNIDILHNMGIILKVDLTDNNEKIVTFGDFHGSYHSFIRLMFRLHVLGVIDFNTFTINEGYRLMFLGDILDRGLYCYEIMYCLLKFIIQNNTNEKQKIFINRGNHEHIEQYGRANYFYKELNSKFRLTPDNLAESSRYSRKMNLHNEIKLLFKIFFSIIPSAIILNSPSNNVKYYCAHGGFPLVNPPRGQTGLIAKVFEDQEISIVDELEANQIRWNDFYGQDNYRKSTTRGLPGTNSGVYQLGTEDVHEFLRNNNFNFIIRGHQDNYYNSWLLLKSSYLLNFFTPDQNEAYAFPLDQISKNLSFLLQFSTLSMHEKILRLMEFFRKTNKINKNVLNFIQKPNRNVDNKIIDGPIATIKTSFSNWSVEGARNRNFSKSFNNYATNEQNENDENIFELFPVLTISTNTDFNRYLQFDSFILLRFDQVPVHNLNNPRPLFTKSTFIHNINHLKGIPVNHNPQASSSSSQVAKQNENEFNHALLEELLRETKGGKKKSKKTIKSKSKTKTKKFDK